MACRRAAGQGQAAGWCGPGWGVLSGVLQDASCRLRGHVQGQEGRWGAFLVRDISSVG